jgi:hypothetical protein
MTLNRTAFFSIAAACVTSVTYVFSTGVDWTVAVRSGIVASSFVTALILSAWTCVPYLMLLPTAGRHGSPPFAIFALFCILAFGLYSMQQGRHRHALSTAPVRDCDSICLVWYAWSSCSED